MADRVRIVVAGAGAFGREHLQTLARMDDVEIAGVADIDVAAAHRAAEQHGGRYAADAVELLDQLRPDGLIVATPGQTHVPLAAEALRRDIPVLVEKPVAMSVVEARALAAAEAESSGFVLPGHILRFSEAHRRLAGIARSDAVGRILSISARRHRDDSHATRYPDIDPVLMTMIHDIDLAVWISGAAPVQVWAARRPASSQRSQTIASVQDDKDALWQLTTAWTFPGEAPPDRLEVIGEAGSVELEVGGRLLQYGAATWTLALDGPDDALHAELSYFTACIRRGERPRAVTLAEAITGLMVAEAAMASLKSGEAVRP